MKGLGLAVVLSAAFGPAGLHAQDNSQRITSSEPGAIMAAIEARCRSEIQSRNQNGIQSKSCSGIQTLVISDADMCGLPLGLRQGSKDQWDQFVGDCLPRLMFGQAKFTVGEYVFKRKIIEDAGEIYTPDHEAVNVTYMVEICAGQSQYVSGMAYVGTRKGSVFLMLHYPPECLKQNAGE